MTKTFLRPVTALIAAILAPGLAHAETITTFHSARFMADPNAANSPFLDNTL